MPRIQQLPPDVVTKIAAGEVIERPASVVKELLENSLDAGATRIEIEVEQAGSELIRIVDNGHGIAPEDLPLAFASHATSKLRTADDLFNIHTKGFRGEALASIAGIAHVLIQSRTASAEMGAELRGDGSTLGDVRPWGGALGTRIEVRHLFFNVPVRKKFLKAASTELGHISEIITRLALAHPTVHFVFKHNNKLVYEVPASATLADRITLFFGSEVGTKLYEIDSGPGPYRVTGYITDPACDRGNAKLQYLFINERWFRDRSVGHAVQEGYRGLLMTGRYAVAFLFLTVPPDAVDVNVHPTKSEVRFRDNSLIFSLVRAAVKNRLMKEQLVPLLRAPETFSEEPTSQVPEPAPLFPPLWSIPVARPTPSVTAPPEGMPSFSPRRQQAESAPSPWDEVIPPRKPAEAAQPAAPLAATTDEPLLPLDPPDEPAPIEKRVFALPSSLPQGSALQVHDSYIVLETPEGMLVIDQHALHERILYEQLRRRVRDGNLEIQRLLIPLAIDLPAEQHALVLESSETFARLGLEVTDFGGNTIALSSYPSLLSRRPPHEILQEVIDELVTHDRAPSPEALFNHVLATMACKAAVKAGDRLPPEEIAHLLHLRQFAEDSHHCPHGRPTSLLFSRAQLDKQFGRT